MDLKDLKYGNRVTVRVDNPAHGDHWADGMSGVVDSIRADPQDDHVRYEVTVRFDDESIGSILHYNLEKDES
jgi:hypothetical protein